MAFPLTVLLALFLPVFAAGNQFGFFGCPDLRTRTDQSVSYDAAGIANISLTMQTRGSFILYAADEDVGGATTSCVTLTYNSSNFIVTYYMDMTAHQTDLKYDISTGLFSSPLPKNVLGSWDDTSEFKLTLVSDKNGVLVFEMCHPTFLTHYISTFVFTDSSIEAAALDYECMLDGISHDYNINALPKGVC